MTSRAKKLESLCDVLIDFTQKLADRTGNEELGKDFMTAIGLIRSKTPGIDGRIVSWTPERKRLAGERISKFWEAQRKMKDEEHTYYAYKYSDIEPDQISGVEELAKSTGLSQVTLSRRLSDSPLGLIVKNRGQTIIYAKNKQNMDRLRHAIAEQTGDLEKIIHLPKAPADVKKVAAQLYQSKNDA
jgi:hypothetical protein